MTQYQSQSQGDGTAVAPPPSDFVVWGEVAGSKKGRVYGLGSEASSATPQGSSQSRSTTGSETSEELERIRQELAATREREERLLREQEETRAEAREREERLLRESREREERMAAELEAMRRSQDERYTHLEQMMLTMATTAGRGVPLQLTRDDILGPPSRAASSGSSRGSRGSRGGRGGGRT